MAESTKDSVLFQREGKPPAGELLPLALQHVVAAVVGIITPAIIVANTCGLTADEKTMLIQVSLVMAGLITLVQAHPLFNGKIGSGLPIIMGASFAYVPTLTSIGGSFGIGAIIGAELIGGLVAIVFGIFLKQIRKLFPPVVTGTVVFCIGLSLYTVAIGYMAGGKGSANFGSAQNWIVAIITLVACVYFGNFTKGVTKLGSLLFGMLVGFVLAEAFEQKYVRFENTRNLVRCILRDIADVAIGYDEPFPVKGTRDIGLIEEIIKMLQIAFMRGRRVLFLLFFVRWRSLHGCIRLFSKARRKMAFSFEQMRPDAPGKAQCLPAVRPFRSSRRDHRKPALCSVFQRQQFKFRMRIQQPRDAALILVRRKGAG